MAIKAKQIAKILQYCSHKNIQFGSRICKVYKALARLLITRIRKKALPIVKIFPT